MAQRIIALDLSEPQLRAVAIESTFRDYRVTGLYKEEGSSSAPLAQRLRTFVAEHGLHADTVLVTIPNELATQRTLVLPFRDRSRLNQTVPFELESMVPFGLDDVIVDYQVLHRSRTSATVLAALVRKRDLQEQLATLAAAGLDPKVIDFSPLCSLNLLTTTARGLPDDYAFVDLAPHNTIVGLCRGGQLVGVRSVLTQPAPAGDGTGGGPVAGLVRDLRWTLTALNGGQFPATLPCVLTGEPPELAAAVATTANEAGALSFTPLESLPRRALPGVADGLAATFVRPLGLALREVAPATAVGLNFRRDEFAYRRGQAQLQRSLIRTGALAAAVLLLVVVNLAVSYQLERARVAAIERQIRNVFKQTLPEVAISGNPVTQLQSEIESMQNKLGMLANSAPVGSLTAIDLLRAVTLAIPSSVIIDTDEYTMDPDAVRIRGKTQSFESVDDLKTRLASLPYFREVQIKDPKTSRDGNGVEFRMILTLSKPSDEAAP